MFLPCALWWRRRFGSAGLLGSPGCQPVVAGSPAGNIFRRNSKVTPPLGLGKLPSPAGQQPALPRKIMNQLL